MLNIHGLVTVACVPQRFTAVGFNHHHLQHHVVPIGIRLFQRIIQLIQQSRYGFKLFLVLCLPDTFAKRVCGHRQLFRFHVHVNGKAATRYPQEREASFPTGFTDLPERVLPGQCIGRFQRWEKECAIRCEAICPFFP